MLATAALIVGTFLATPYAFIYDMAMMTNAVLIVVHDKQRTKRRLMIPEMFILILALSVPAIMMETWRFFLAGSIGLILLFGLIAWRIFTWSGSDHELAPS